MTKTKCIPAIDRAFQLTKKQTILATKFCQWIDLIALIRNQIKFDISANLTTNSSITAELTSQLIDQLDSIGSVYTGLNGLNVSAESARDFGLIAEINCKTLDILILDCNPNNLTIDLGDLATPGLVNYNSATVGSNAYLEFLCCIANHFRYLSGFLQRYSNAKNCEKVC